MRRIIHFIGLGYGIAGSLVAIAVTSSGFAALPMLNHVISYALALVACSRTSLAVIFAAMVFQAVLMFLLLSVSAHDSHAWASGGIQVALITAIPLMPFWIGSMVINISTRYFRDSKLLDPRFR